MQTACHVHGSVHIHASGNNTTAPAPLHACSVHVYGLDCTVSGTTGHLRVCLVEFLLLQILYVEVEILAEKNDFYVISSGTNSLAAVL